MRTGRQTEGAETSTGGDTLHLPRPGQPAGGLAPLVRKLDAGEPAVRLAAARGLAELPPAPGEVPLLLGLLTGRDEDVQEWLVKAIANAIAKDDHPDIDSARERAGRGLLSAMGGGLVGRAAHEAAKVIAAVSGPPGPLHVAVRALVDHLGAAGVVSYSVPTGGDLTSVVLAATRSKAAHERLLLMAEQLASPELLEHEVLNQLDALRRRAEQATQGAKHNLLPELNRILAQLDGLSFGSLEANRGVAAIVNGALDAFGMRIRCPESGCGLTARLAVNKGGISGEFALDHGRLSKKRYHHRSVRLYPLILTDAQ